MCFVVTLKRGPSLNQSHTDLVYWIAFCSMNDLGNRGVINHIVGSDDPLTPDKLNHKRSLKFLFSDRHPMPVDVQLNETK